MQGPTLSKLIVLAMVAAIGVFACRKLTTIPQLPDAGEGSRLPRQAAQLPPAPDRPAERLAGHTPRKARRDRDRHSSVMVRRP